MKNLTVRARLTLTIGLMTFLMAALAVMSLLSLSNARDRLDKFVYGIQAQAQLAADFRGAVNRRAIAARNLVLVTRQEDLTDEKAAVTKAHEDVSKLLQQLKDAAATPGMPEEVRTKVATVDGIEAKYGPIATDIVQLALNGKQEPAIAKMNDECRPALKALLAAVGDYLTLTQTRSKQMLDDAAADYATQRMMLIGVCLFAFASAAALGWTLVVSLTQALGAEPKDLNEAVLRVAAGDLSPVPGADRAPSSSVLAAVGRMQQDLSAIVSQVRNTGDSIATGSSQIATGNADLSQRTEEQASNLQQTSASMMEIRSTVEKNADTARQATQLASSASHAAQQGGEVMGQVVETMQDIAASSRKVTDIIAVIDGIAFQTNILALNAAVEAARAGEQGRGFAVVAGEVRTLAQRSAEAAKEIKTLISASTEKVDNGTRLVESAGTSINDIVGQVRKVADFIGEITSSAIEQTTTIGQVSDAVGQLDQVTQQNAALVEESAAAAESLKHQAALLTELVNKFQLTGHVASQARANQATSRPNRPAATAAGSRPAPSSAKAPEAPSSSSNQHDWETF
ncbi:MAG TPA: methyl-accepting chemotaxis protein [Aquabacterium sp.]|uniref:methyl-accepting chemotaxis protein n=1 Tax=Aquabacterium sp. TaxID=1872578 RepID=UPI002E34D913|nr:methyl-accepting chemotaxis protein [Aquabacterium sp.]HEX5357360.1 methyl-accepting chemotaxis protein [Aquabacterium sp.]